MYWRSPSAIFELPWVKWTDDRVGGGRAAAGAGVAETGAATGAGVGAECLHAARARATRIIRDKDHLSCAARREGPVACVTPYRGGPR